MAELCYITFEGDILTEPTKSEKGNVFFLAKTQTAKGDITTRVMLRGPAAAKIISQGDRIFITNGTVYVGKKDPSYLFNVAVEKEQYIHVVSHDDGIVNIENITGGF